MFRLTFCVLVIFFSCKPKESSFSEGTDVMSSQFGDTIDTSKVISYDSLLALMQTNDSVYVTITSKVSSVCQVKGCWMTVMSHNKPESPEMFVQFKDYGFFMPADISGKSVIMQGVAYREMTSIEDLKHYAEDEGLTQEEIDNITEPKEEIKFMASGVVIKE